MNFSKIYALGLRHLYLIMNSFPRVLDLIYWPTVQIFLWGFISKFFTLNSEYYSNTVGVILTAAILYDFLFRASISFNMMFLEEIWSRNFTNLFIAPLKIREIIAALTLTAIIRTLIGLIPAVLIAIPLFGVSVLELGLPFIPIRKKGKLPHTTIEESYELEYGKATIEIHSDALDANDNVLIIDDLIATGGTALAAISLVKRLEASIAGCSFIIDLPVLEGNKKITDLGIEVQTLCEFSGH